MGRLRLIGILTLLGLLDGCRSDDYVPGRRTSKDKPAATSGSVSVPGHAEDLNVGAGDETDQLVRHYLALYQAEASSADANGDEMDLSRPSPSPSSQGLALIAGLSVVDVVIQRAYGAEFYYFSWGLRNDGQTDISIPATCPNVVRGTESFPLTSALNAATLCTNGIVAGGATVKRRAEVPAAAMPLRLGNALKICYDATTCSADATMTQEPPVSFVPGMLTALDANRNQVLFFAYTVAKTLRGQDACFELIEGASWQRMVRSLDQQICHNPDRQLNVGVIAASDLIRNITTDSMRLCLRNTQRCSAPTAAVAAPVGAVARAMTIQIVNNTTPPRYVYSLLKMRRGCFHIVNAAGERFDEGINFCDDFGVTSGILEVVSDSIKNGLKAPLLSTGRYYICSPTTPYVLDDANSCRPIQVSTADVLIAEDDSLHPLINVDRERRLVSFRFHNAPRAADPVDSCLVLAQALPNSAYRRLHNQPFSLDPNDPDACRATGLRSHPINFRRIQMKSSVFSDWEVVLNALRNESKIVACRLDSPTSTTLVSCSQIPATFVNAVIPRVCAATQKGSKICSVANGYGFSERTCGSDSNWSDFGACQVVACLAGYTLSTNGDCVAIP